MAHSQSQYGAPRTDEYGNVLSTDEYGNIIRTDAYGNVIRTDEYGNVIHTDEYGNVIRTEEYGNPIRHSGTNAGTYGAGGFDTTTILGQGMRHDVTAAGHGGDRTGKLHRSGSSSSSSSSEDDGQGGRRKKGLKEKIPGMGHKEHRSATSATTTPGYTETQAAHEHHHEKKGVMEKIKEKLPGGHHSSENQY